METKEICVNIPNEIAKGQRGRDFNLLFCGEALMEYIKRNNLKSDDYLFNFNHTLLNKKMQKVAVQLFGDKISHTKAGGKFSEMTLYDLRHSGAIHLRILANKNGKISLDSIRERGGWSDFKMLNYYTKFIGLTGKINKGELIIEEDKSKMQKEINDLNETLSLITEVLNSSELTKHIFQALLEKRLEKQK